MPLKQIENYYRLFLFSGFWYPVPKGTIGTLFFIAQLTRNLFFLWPWFLCLVGLYYEGFRKSMTGSAFFFVIGLINNVQQVIFYFKRYDTHVIMDMIKMSINSHQTMWEQEFVRNRAAISWKIVKMYCITMMFVSAFMYIFIPVLNIFLEYFDVQTLNLPLPFRGFSSGKLKKDSMDRYLEFAGLIWCYLGISSYVGVQCAFFFFTQHTASEIELICEKIRRLRFIHDERNFLIDNVTTSPDFVTLRDIIQNHQSVLKLGRKVITFFGLPFAVQNNVGSVCLCLTLISAFSELHRDSSVVAVSVLISLSMIGQLISVCYFGHQLVEQSNMIHRTLYELPWYRLTPHTRKGLILIFMQAVNPIEINYHGVARINLRTFMQAINAAYSYFTLLKSTIDE